MGLACAEFNGGITDRLLTGALDALEESGCDLAKAIVAWVPGAFELPVVAQQLARSGAVDAVICLGAVIRGDTGHYEFVAGECASGLQRVQLDTGVPVVFGVLTTDTIDQALERSADDQSNKGREAAPTAVDTVSVLDRWRRPRPGAGSGSPSGSADAAPGTSQGLPRAGHPGAVRLGRPGGVRSSDVDYRASIDDPRIDRGPDPAAPGDPALRGRRAVRHRDHRAGLGGGAGERRDLARRAPLLEGHRQSDPGGPGRSRRLAGVLGGRSGRLGSRGPRARCGCRPSTPS